MVKEAKKTTKGNAVPSVKAPAPEAERLDDIDELVLFAVRIHEDPHDWASGAEYPPTRAQIRASVAKLLRLGRIRRAAGYVATARGPEAKAEKRGNVTVLDPYALAQEFCLPVDAVAALLERVGIPSESRAQKTVRFISGPEGYPVARAFIAARLCSAEEDARELFGSGLVKVDGRPVRHDQWLRPGKTYRLSIGSLAATFELSANPHESAISYVEAG